MLLTATCCVLACEAGPGSPDPGTALDSALADPEEGLDDGGFEADQQVQVLIPFFRGHFVADVQQLAKAVVETGILLVVA